MNPDPDAEWKSYWGIRHAPCDGISEAIPYALHRSESASRPLPEPFLPNNVPHTVLWMGRSSKYGLMVNSSSWNPGQSGGKPPDCPADGWKPWDVQTDLTGHRSPLPMSVSEVPPGTYFPLPTSDRNRTQTDVLKKRKIGNRELKKFLSLTPGFVLDAMALRDAHPQSLVFRAISFMMGNDPQGGTDARTASLRRCQFMSSMPLSCIFLDPPQLCEKIDSGRPMTPELARRWECSERIVSAMGRLSVEGAVELSKKLRGGLSYQPLMVMAFMDSLPTAYVEWMIADEGKTDRILATFHMIGEAWMLCGHSSSAARHRIRDDLCSLAKSVRRHPIHGYDWITTAHNPIAHVSDLCLDFARDILVPARALGGNANDTCDSERRLAFRLLSAEGLPRLLKASLTHLNGGVHGPRIGVSSPQGSEWPLPCEEEFHLEGRTLRFLRAQGELDEETRSLSHCVWSYGGDCRRGGCSIMSVGDWTTDGVWLPTSTVEIRVDKEGRPLVAQHRSERNAPPSQSDANALLAWMDLEGKASKTDASLANWAHLNPSGHESGIFVEDHLGEGWRTPEAHEYRWDRWRRILGVRDGNAADFVERILEHCPTVTDTDEDRALISVMRDVETEMQQERDSPSLEREVVLEHARTR